MCPSGKAIGDLATSTTHAHAMAECSNRLGVFGQSQVVCCDLTAEYNAIDVPFD